MKGNDTMNKECVVGKRTEIFTVYIGKFFGAAYVLGGLEKAGAASGYF